jgi:hypothetical protein
MFVDELRRAVEASPRVELAKVASLLWKAWGQGLLSDAEAQSIGDMIEAKRALPVPPPRPRALLDRVPERRKASPDGGDGWRAAGYRRSWLPPSRPPRSQSCP